MLNKLHIFIFSSLHLHIINIYIIYIYLRSSLEQEKKLPGPAKNPWPEQQKA